jgi:ligand-binding SRPBCC domain-containing protein
MMRLYARLRGLRRVLLPVPVLTPRLSGLWLGLVTPAQARVGRALVEGLRNSTVVRSPAATETFAIHPITLRQAFVRAIDEGSQGQLKTDRRLAVVEAPPAQAFAPIRRIGGRTGWYFANALWRLRGWIDVGLGGAGMPRSRRDPDDCVAGDVIDGWPVDAYQPDRLLRLSAGLKLPGRGSLEFRVTSLDGGARSLIQQTATFDPKGIAGRLYWYAVLPLHALVFRGLLHRIAQRAVRHVDPADHSVFSYASIIDAPATDVFRWHEQPGALASLTPPALVRIEQQEGGIRDGGRVTVSVGLGPARVRWSMRHYDYTHGRRFCDEQVAGPFAVWRHAHLFEPLGPRQTLYEDRIEFAVFRRGALNRFAASLLRPLLRVAFAQRHGVVRTAVDTRQRKARQRTGGSRKHRSLRQLVRHTCPAADAAVDRAAEDLPGRLFRT